jgi:putative peptidoglycan lipid II flippase
VVSTVANLLLLVLAVLAAAAFVAAPTLAAFVAPGFDAADTARLVELTRIMLLSPIFLALSAVATSVLNASGRFAASVLAPIVYNLVVIVAAALFVPQYGLTALAWGTVAASLGAVLVQVGPLFRQARFVYTPRVDLGDAEARRTLALLGPRAVGLAGSQMTLLVLTSLGSTLGPGAIGAFGLAFVIFQIPLGTIAYPLGIVALPTLAQRVAIGALDEYVDLVTRALRLLAFVMLPVACIAAGVALPVVDLVINFGRVEEAGVILTSEAFAGLLAALPTEAMVIVLSRAYFAARNTWIPVAAALTSVAVAIGVALALTTPLGILGLALGLVAASWVEASLLLVAFRRRHGAFSLRRLGMALAGYGAAGIAAGLVAARAYDLLATALPVDPGILGSAAALAGAAAAGGGTYLLIAVLLRAPELGAVAGLVRAALRRGAA